MEVEKAKDSGVTPLSIASESESVGSGQLYSGSKGVKRKRAVDMERKPLELKSVNPGATSSTMSQASSSVRSRTSSRGSSPGRSASAPAKEMTDTDLEILHWLFAHIPQKGESSFNLQLMQQVKAMMEWMEGNGVMRITTMRDVEPSSQNKRRGNPPRNIEEKTIYVQDNKMFGKDMITKKQTTSSKPSAVRGNPCAIWDLKEEMPLKGNPANTLSSCLQNNEQCKKLMALAKKRRVDRPARSIELACGRKLKDLTKVNPTPVTKEDATQTHVSFPLAEYSPLGALRVLGSKRKISASMKGYHVTHAEIVRDLPRTN